MLEVLRLCQEQLPARVQKLSVGIERDLFFELYAGQKRPVYFCVSPAGWSLLAEKPAHFQVPERPSALQGQLRKELLTSNLVAIGFDESNRTLTWTFQNAKNGKRCLVAELHGRDPRLVLLHHKTQEAPGRVLSVVSGSVKSIDGRDLRRGQTYVWPQSAGSALPLLDPTSAKSSGGVETPKGTLVELSQVSRRLKSESKRIDRLILALQQDLARHGEPEQLREAGEWLKTCLSRIERGTERFDYTNAEGQACSVRLEPQLDAPANLERLFKRAKRAEAGMQRILPKLQLAETQRKEINKWRAQLGKLSQGPVANAEPQVPPGALEQLVADAHGFLATLTIRPSAKRQALQQSTRKAWRAFSAHGEVVIRVGRSAKDNDALTFHGAKGNDVWVHAREVAGSHVIVPAPKGHEIPWETLLDAAHLALWFSPHRGQERSDVQYTRKKYVSKPGKGAAPGFVHVHHEKVLHIRFEDERIQRLLANEVPP